MANSVLVIAGEWHCLELGNWRFRVSKDIFARCVDIVGDETYKQVRDKVGNAFGVDQTKHKVMLSFWAESKETVLTQTKMPPVSIGSESELAQFRRTRARKSDISIFVTITNRNCGQDVIRGSCKNAMDKMVIHAVEDAEQEYNARRVGEVPPANAGQDFPLTFEPPDFLAEIDKLGDMYGGITMGFLNNDAAVAGPSGRHERQYLVDNIESRKHTDMSRCSSYSSPEYDFDVMGKMIDTDYPEDWDPYAVSDRRDEGESSRKNYTEHGRESVGGLRDSEVGDVTFGGVLNGREGTVMEDTNLTPIGFSLGIGNENTTSQNVMVSSGRVVGQCNDVADVPGLVVALVADGINEISNVVEGEAAAGCAILCAQNVDKAPNRTVGVAVGDGIAEGEGQSEFDHDGQDVLVDVVVRERGQDGCVISGHDGLVDVVVNEDESDGDRTLSSKTSSEGLGDSGGVSSGLVLGEIVGVNDDAPYRDNVVQGPSDKANMNLRKAGDAIYEGRVFRDKAELRKALSVYSVKRLFNFRIAASDTTRVIATCVDKKCHWRVYATNHKGSQNLEIRTTTLKHNCDVSARGQYGRKATATILGDLLKAKYAHGKKGPRACELPEIVLAELNVTISYMKAWNARELAMHRARGTEEESYKFLATYLHLLKETNPGTLATVHTTQNSEGLTLFRYLFFAFGASIAGFKYLRKVIVIDGTQTKGKYKSCLVAASGQDENMQIFPLGFGIIDGENTAGWTWFFRKLSQFVPDAEDLVFVSDRHAAIYAGLRAVYPLAKHGACSVHLFRNIKHQFHSEGLAAVVSKAARAYTVGEFGYWFKEIQTRKQTCAAYLAEIGFDHWSLAYFPGMRYNLMSSNISESLNSALQKVVEYPIVTMVEAIRTKLMGWFYKRREVAKKTLTQCTPEIEELLIDNLKEATDCSVLSASEWIYQVNDSDGLVFTVDLQKKSCTCRVFDVLLVPCSHAMATVAIRNVDYYSLVGDCYSVDVWMKLWEKMILPPRNEADTEIPMAVRDGNNQPPKTRRGAGRPKKKRIPSQGEHHAHSRKKPKPNKCGTCGEVGHNRGTCKNPI